MEIITAILAGDKTGTLKPIVFASDVQKDIDNLMSVVIKDNDFEQSLGHPYFDLDIDHRLKITPVIMLSLTLIRKKHYVIMIQEKLFLAGLMLYSL
ncbi:hypothetical protein I3679_021495 [Proteus mirabilis]|uniref:Uncharacterized protein n=1 Tax=Proteus mirabilis TaxID=584 RepID=A0ABD5LVK8_PROMI